MKKIKKGEITNKSEDKFENVIDELIEVFDQMIISFKKDKK